MEVLLNAALSTLPVTVVLSVHQIVETSAAAADTRCLHMQSPTLTTPCATTTHSCAAAAITIATATAITAATAAAIAVPPFKVRRELRYIHGQCFEYQWLEGMVAAHCPTAHCPTAPLPHCPTAPLPHCPTAPLPHCPTALLVTLRSTDHLPGQVDYSEECFVCNH